MNPRKGVNAITLRNGREIGSHESMRTPIAPVEDEVEAVESPEGVSKPVQNEISSSISNKVSSTPLNKKLNTNELAPPFPSRLAKQVKEDKEKDI